MSSNTMIRQVPINNTIQVNVGPGNQTGLYYILLSNLPWQTSWKQMKDHVRTVCSAVERVEIFNESTSGWVCVRGRENFRAAMRHLSRTPFQDRPIFIDGRNAKEEIPIKRLVGGTERPMATPRSPRTPRTAPQMMPFPVTTPPLMSPTASSHGQWPSPSTISVMSSPTVYGMPPMGPAMSGDYRDNNYWYQSYDNNYVENAPMVLGQIPAYQAELSYQYSQPSEPYNNHYSTMPDISQAPVQTHMQSSPAVIETEYRKIIIKNLSRWAQSDQIKSLLRSRCGFGGGEVNSIKIPRSREGGNRRHAMITFEKGEHAARAVQRLHDFRFEGHQLDVKITNEGVSQNEERKPKRQPAENPSSCASVQEKKEKPIKKGVVVANGSSIRPTTQPSEGRSKR